MPTAERTRLTIARHGTSARAVTARKPYVCTERSFRPDTCQQVIPVGGRYVRSVIFAGHDAHPGPRGTAPWMRRLCPACADRFDTTRGLIADQPNTQTPAAAA